MVKNGAQKKARESRFDVTPSFRALLLDLTVSFLIEQPHDIIQFGTDYFAQLKTKFTSEVEKNDAEKTEDEDSTAGAAHVRGRRKSVFAEAYNPEDDIDEEETVNPKTDEQRAALEKHVKDVVIFNGLRRDQLNTVLDAMFLKKVSAGEEIIKEGDEGDYFYIIESGKFDAYVENKLVHTYNNSGSFGELALLYSMPRSATVIAVTDGQLWCLDRQTFRKIVLKSAFKKRKLYETLIDQVPMLKKLSAFEKMNLADALDPRSYKDGDVIMKEGDAPDGMYFVESGTVIITKKQDQAIEIELTIVEKGGYFGELSLVTNQERAATAVAKGDVKCAFLNTEAFERLLGPCKDIMARNVEKYKEQFEQASRSSL